MVLGMVSTNCYLVYNNDTKEGVVVDPADNGAYILNKCTGLCCCLPNAFYKF